MDGRLREATTIEISTALGKLFRALQPKKGSVEDLSESYLIACHKCTKHALETVIVKLIRGEIEGMSKSFAPSSAELSAAIRSEMQWVERQIALAQERMQIEDNRPVAVAPMLLTDRINAARERMALEERRFLFAVDSHAGFMARRKEIPIGGTYLAILGEVYGPAGSLRQPVPPPMIEVTQEMLRADMFEPEPESPVDEVPDMPPMAPVEAYEDVEF